MTNLDSTLKSTDITLPTKVRLAKAMVFPVIMYGREPDSAECFSRGGPQSAPPGSLFRRQMLNTYLRATKSNILGVDQENLFY